MVLIAAFLENGIEFDVDPKSASFSYVLMTLGVLKDFGIKWELNGNQLLVFPVKWQSTAQTNYVIEADWSSAAFFYGVQSIVKKDQIFIAGLKENSLQGDLLIIQLAKDLGITSVFSKSGVCLQSIQGFIPKETVNWDFSQCPDLAPVLIIAAVLNFKTGLFTGLENLNYKESQRLQLLNDYLNALGVTTQLTAKSLEFEKLAAFPCQINTNTAHDHRMVMCLTLLSIAVNSVYLNEVDSVVKSFPEFWEQAYKLGFGYTISR
jgi:3-phosphoshikimate 1-carboxyvinyltransferase